MLTSSHTGGSFDSSWFFNVQVEVSSSRSQQASVMLREARVAGDPLTIESASSVLLQVAPGPHPGAAPLQW